MLQKLKLQTAKEIKSALMKLKKGSKVSISLHNIMISTNSKDCEALSEIGKNSRTQNNRLWKLENFLGMNFVFVFVLIIGRQLKWFDLPRNQNHHVYHICLPSQTKTPFENLTFLRLKRKMLGFPDFVEIFFCF